MNASVDPVATLPSIEAELNYWLPKPGRPRTYTFDPPPGEARSTVESDPHRVALRDLRPQAGRFTLDEHGFGLVRHESAVVDWGDEEAIRTVYYPEAERLLREITGAARVFVFDHTLRRRIAGAADNRDGPRQPVARVHVDHTARSGPQRVRDLIPEDAEALLAGRVQVINLWRPLHGPLRDHPLAVADARTVPFEDLVAADLIYPHRVGETYQVRFNEAHRWYYVSGQLPEEVLLLKCFDSLTDGRARFAPHTAFIDPTAPADARPRESIELRTLVFHPA